ncbi:hypothetical protein PSQ19_06195 [Devosia algicola]|uniref:Phage protein n=1 Tax=Devosia algicola TaxID=3026418 RepID=A0ABY7YRA4_9HYPH|nr:hypothetical protein [Devosia algicola]WDR03658.1 hypothetical protein PSQ19_06195 [Devosia algicola]
MAQALSTTGNERIAMGANQPPEQIIFGEIEAYYDEAKNWASDGFEIESQEQADQIDMLDKALLKASQEAEALRVEEKRPLDEQISAIQAKFNPYIQKGKGKVDLGRSVLKALLGAWRIEQQRIKDAEARKIREEAEAAERAAQEAFRQSGVADLEQREEAERMAERAAELAKQSKQADKAATTKTGLRTSYRAELTDLNAAVQHYWKTDRAEFEALVQTLAAKSVRSGAREIPGFEIKTIKEAI